MLACMARKARGGPDRKSTFWDPHVRLALVKSRSSVVEMVFRFETSTERPAYHLNVRNELSAAVLLSLALEHIAHIVCAADGGDGCGKAPPMGEPPQ